MRQIFAALSATAAAAALSGCATIPPAGPGEASVGAARPAKVQARASDRNIEGPAPETLIGSAQEAVLKLVGAPALVRREKGVDVWQYTDEACTLLLYFYEKEGARQLTYLEALPKVKDAAGVSEASCLSGQIRAFRAKDLG